MTQDLLKLTASLGIRQGTDTTYYKAVKLAEKYAELRVQQEQDKKIMNGFVQAFKRGFATGYKKGYCHRSDKKYNKAIFGYWLKYVADGVEKNCVYAEDVAAKFKIVEPEVIIR